jgi:hypothetical protein
MKPRAYFGLSVFSLFVVTACSTAITPDQISQVKPAMSIAQVTTLLGQPAHIDHAETTGIRGDVYHYPAPNGEGRVTFLNDTVFKAEFVPGAKS